MVDDYQDTNNAQYRLVSLLSAARRNLCVVGDDDQGLYRFRGATIRNILEFPDKFPKGACRIVKLTVNYRSNSDIVDCYNEWTQTTELDRTHGFEWNKYRHDKRIVPHVQTTLKSKAVVRIATDEGVDAWMEKNLDFVIALRNSGKLQNLNQMITTLPLIFLLVMM